MLRLKRLTERSVSSLGANPEQSELPINCPPDQMIKLFSEPGMRVKIVTTMMARVFCKGRTRYE